MKIDDFSVPCQLVYLKTNDTIVKFPNGLQNGAEFSKEHQIYKKEMEKSGIEIDRARRDQYPELSLREKSVILLSDASFGKAFYEVYVPIVLGLDKFEWRTL